MPKGRKSAPDNSEQEPLTFEQAFTKLGETVESLEQGGLPLAQATALYEEGMTLVRRCNELLHEAELKITQLKEDQAVPAPGLEWEEDEE